MNSPVELLLAYLSEPEKNAWAELAHAAATHAVVHSHERIGDEIVGTIFGQISLTSVPLGDQFRARRLHLEAAGADELTQEVWNSFLTFANLMWLSPDQLTVTSGTGASASTATTPASETVSAPAAVPEEWQEIFADFEGESDVEQALRVLVDVGAPATDVIGEEFANSPSVLAWPQQQIVMFFKPDTDADAAADMRAQGWTVLYADTLTIETIPAELTEKA